MTWRELLARVWFFLRAHLRRQHMCPECGDACVKVYSMHAGCEGAWWWECEACAEEQEEWRTIQRENLASLTREDPMPYLPPPAGEGFGMHVFNEVFKQVYTGTYPGPIPYHVIEDATLYINGG